ncbi:MAG: PP2C family protein-serine/threonine phosphatase [Acidobacteria bacterium]|nr:PP2C family protein-serine/threonine phosphatase [Acidobacteriota bacterium]
MPRRRSRSEQSVRRRAALGDEQLELARAVQRSLLPTPLGPTVGIELVARFVPAQGVAGDFYDYFPLRPNQVGFYLGDVQGKGLEGAMYAALVSGIMRGLEKTGNQPAQVLDFLNRRLRLRPIPNKFCTLSYSVLELSQRRLIFSNGGLPYPFLCRGGQVTRIELPGFPLGLFDTATYEQQEISLEAGDLLVVFSDGLTDSLENHRVRDGDAFVRSLLGHATKLSALDVADELVARLPVLSPAKRPRELADDVTFLVLRVA